MGMIKEGVVWGVDAIYFGKQFSVLHLCNASYLQLYNVLFSWCFIFVVCLDRDLNHS